MLDHMVVRVFDSLFDLLKSRFEVSQAILNSSTQIARVIVIFVYKSHAHQLESLFQKRKILSFRVSVILAYFG